MAEFIPDVSPTAIARKLARASLSDLNAAFDVGTHLGSVVTTDSNGIVIENKDIFAPGEGRASIKLKTPENAFPVMLSMIWTDFGAGNEVNSFGWDMNPERVDPASPRLAWSVELPYVQAGVSTAEQHCTYQSSVNSAAGISYRVYNLGVHNPGHQAELDAKIKKVRLQNMSGGSGGLPDFALTIDTSANIITSYAALGVGADARASANGPMLMVSGTAGSGLEFVRILPTTLANGASLIYVTPPGTNAFNHMFHYVGNHSDASGAILQNLHATGGSQYLAWVLAGAASYRMLTSGGDWTSGVDATGDYYVSQSSIVGTNPGLKITKTTFDITTFGHWNFPDGKNFIYGTITGTKHGTVADQKQAWWGSAPGVQPAAVADATDAASVILRLNELLARLRSRGLIAT